MDSNRGVKFFGNPAFGLTPSLVLAILDTFLSYKIALLLSFLFTVIVAILLLPRLAKRGAYNFMFLIDGFVLGLFTFLSLLPIQEELERYTSVINASLLLVTLLIIYLNKKSIGRQLIRNIKGRMGVNLKKNLYEFYYFIGVLCIVIAIYLIICGVYLVCFKEWHRPHLHALFFDKFRFVLILGMMTYEYIRVYYLNKKLHQEEWLPIIDDKGRVIGRIARSISSEYKNKLLHPRVRIYVFYQGMLYLSSLKNNETFGKYKFDTPFNRDLFFKEELGDCVDEMLRKAGIKHKVMPRFLYRHLYENEKEKRLVFMYKITLKKEEVAIRKMNLKGKFWTEQEIELNKDKGVFSDLFEQEIDLLQSMIFPVERLIAK